MKNYFAKIRTDGACPPRPTASHVLWSWAGGLAGIAATAYLTHLTGAILLMAPFGATCVLAFGIPDSPLAQPRNIVGGHLLSSLIGLVFLALFGNAWWVMGLAVATAIAAMQWTRTVHPPAGADPLVVLMTAPGWAFLLAPVLAGSLLLVVCAVLFNNLAAARRYPKYWV